MQNKLYSTTFIELFDVDSKYLYEKMNTKIEKFTWILHTAITKVSIPFGIIPMVMNSYYLYFTTELGNEAFYWLNFAK